MAGGGGWRGTRGVLGVCGLSRFWVAHSRYIQAHLFMPGFSRSMGTLSEGIRLHISTTQRPGAVLLTLIALPQDSVSAMCNLLPELQVQPPSTPFLRSFSASSSLSILFPQRFHVVACRAGLSGSSNAPSLDGLTRSRSISCWSASADLR